MHDRSLFDLLVHNMDFKPQYYKTTPLSLLMRLESVVDRRGNVRYCVTLAKSGVKETHYLFEYLSSALDFINSNFS